MRTKRGASLSKSRRRAESCIGRSSVRYPPIEIREPAQRSAHSRQDRIRDSARAGSTSAIVIPLPHRVVEDLIAIDFSEAKVARSGCAK